MFPQVRSASIVALLAVVAILAGCAEERLAFMADTVELPVEELGAGQWQIGPTPLLKNGHPYGTAIIRWSCRKGKEGQLGRCTDPELTIDY